MQARIRSAVGALCKDQQRRFTPHFGLPSTLKFGDVASAGVAATRLADGTEVPLISRLDHGHGMPAPPDIFLDRLRNTVWYFTDFLVASAVTDPGIIVYIDGSSGFILDTPLDVVEYGCPGNFNASTSTGAAPRHAGVLFSCGSYTATTETTVGRVLFDRLRILKMKVRLIWSADAQGDLPGYAQAIDTYIGGLITTTNRNLSTITDGCFFRLKTPKPASGLETWEAVCRVGNVETRKDTGIKVPYVPAAGGDQRAGFQRFRIEYDGVGRVDYYIGQVDQGADIPDTLVASIEANLPKGVKFAGWGCYQETSAAAPTLTCDGTMIDEIAFYGARVA